MKQGTGIELGTERTDRPDTPGPGWYHWVGIVLGALAPYFWLALGELLHGGHGFEAGMAAVPYVLAGLGSCLINILLGPVPGRFFSRTRLARRVFWSLYVLGGPGPVLALALAVLVFR